MDLPEIKKHEKYYYYHWEFFQNPQDLVHAFLEKDFDTGLHEQEFYEINVITKGQGIHYIGNNRVEATVGNVFIIPPRMSHGYIGGKGFDVFHVLLSDDFMNKYMSDMQLLPSFHALFGAEPLMRGKTNTALYLTLSSNEFDNIMNILWMIEHYQNFGNVIEDQMRSNFALIAIGLLCKVYSSNIKQTNSILFEERALMESISHIHERYFEKITIDDLLQIAHMSRTSYIKKFKDICKMSPAAYITKIRVDSAAVMLVNTSLGVSEIAYRTGFYDASHFTKSFENTYNISPIEYRKQRTK